MYRIVEMLPQSTSSSQMIPILIILGILIIILSFVFIWLQFFREDKETSGTTESSGPKVTTKTTLVPGTSGTTQTPGTSGPPSIPGTSGPPSIPGTSGPPSIPGTSGTTPPPPPTGTSGTTPPPPPTGTSGTTPPPPPTGTSGTIGSRIIDMYSGTSGTRVISGTSGVTGSSGTQLFSGVYPGINALYGIILKHSQYESYIGRGPFLQDARNCSPPVDMLRMTPNRSEAIVFVIERYPEIGNGFYALRDSVTGKYVRFYCWQSHIGLEDVITLTNGHYHWKITEDGKIINPALVFDAYNNAFNMPQNGYVRADRVDLLGGVPAASIIVVDIVPSNVVLPTFTVTASTTNPTGFTFKGTSPYDITFTLFQGSESLGTVTSSSLSSATGFFVPRTVTPNTQYTFQIKHEFRLLNTISFRTPPELSNFTVVPSVGGFTFKGTSPYDRTFTLFQGSESLGTVTSSSLSSATGWFVSRTVAPNTQYTFVIRNGSTVVSSVTITTPSLIINTFTVTKVSVGATNGFILRATANYNVEVLIVEGSISLGTARIDQLSSTSGVFISNTTLTPKTTYSFTLRYNNIIVASADATEQEIASGPTGSPNVRGLSGPRLSSGVGGDILYFRTIDAAGNDAGLGVTCDSSGNVYFTGNYNGSATIRNQVGSSVGTLPASSGSAGFLSKFDISGNYLYSRIVDGYGDSFAGVVCDPDENVYVCGTSSGGTPVLKNQSGVTTESFFDSSTFFCKFDRTGVHQWSRMLTVSPSSKFTNIACDSRGNVYISGYYSGNGTIMTHMGREIAKLPPASGVAGFVAKFDSTGNYIWSRILDGGSTDEGSGIACDSSGVYLTGYYTGNGIIKTQTGSSITNITRSGPISVGNAAFITKFDTDGTYQWSRIIDSANVEQGRGVACDSTGGVYFTGVYTGTPTLRTENGNILKTLPASVFESSAFVVKIDTSGNYIWTRLIDSQGIDNSTSVTCDLYGTVYVSGSFTGLRNALIKDETQTLKTLPWYWYTGLNAFITAFKSDGTYLYSRIINAGGGAAGDEVALSVSTDPYGDVYCAGYYPANPTIYNDNGQTLAILTSAQGNGAFLFKMYGPPSSQGSQLTSGTSGASGTIGSRIIDMYSGTSGTRVISGTSGASGTIGSRIIDMYSGTSGTRVISGTSGVPGTQPVDPSLLFGVVNTPYDISPLNNNPLQLIGTIPTDPVMRFTTTTGFVTQKTVPYTFPVRYEMYVMFKSFPTSGAHYIFRVGNAIEAYVNPNGQFVSRFQSGSTRFLSVYATLQLNRWHHILVTATIEKTCTITSTGFASDGYKIYLDGNYLNKYCWITNSLAAYTSNPIVVGKDTSAGRLGFDGWLSNLKIYTTKYMDYSVVPPPPPPLPPGVPAPPPAISSGTVVPKSGEVRGMYPPAPMSSNVVYFSGYSYGNGFYIANASTRIINSGYEYLAFDNTNVSAWTSSGGLYTMSTGQYTGAVQTITNVTTRRGEWISLWCPEQFILKKISLSIWNSVGTANYYTRAPRNYVICGSNNGSDWFEIQNVAESIFTRTILEVVTDITNNSTPYNRYRIIILDIQRCNSTTETCGSTSMTSIANIKFFA